MQYIIFIKYMCNLIFEHVSHKKRNSSKYISFKNRYKSKNKRLEKERIAIKMNICTLCIYKQFSIVQSFCFVEQIALGTFPRSGYLKFPRSRIALNSTATG